MRSGRLTARERIHALVDDGSWREIGLLALPELRREAPSPGDAIITGLGRIGGRKVCVVAIDATVLAGTTAPVNMRKQNRVAEWAGKRGHAADLPLRQRRRPPAGPAGLALLGRARSTSRTFLQSPEGCPSIPRITAVLGPSFGDAALHAAIADLVVMKRDAAIALSGPPVIKGAIGEDISNEELGGPAVAHETSRQRARRRRRGGRGDRLGQALPLLPARRRRPAGAGRAAGRAGARRRGAADARPGATRAAATTCARCCRRSSTRDSLFNWGERYGRSLITALARIDGQPVGVVASASRCSAPACSTSRR